MEPQVSQFILYGVTVVTGIVCAQVNTEETNSCRKYGSIY